MTLSSEREQWLESTEMKARQLTEAPLQLRVTREFPVSQEQLFAMLKDFEAAPKWIPFVRHVEVDHTEATEPGGVGTIRKMRSPVGSVTEERVRAIDPPSFLAYSAADEGLWGMYTDHTSVLACRSLAVDRCELSWSVYARPGKSFFKRTLGRPVFRFVVARGTRRLHGLLADA